MAGIFPSIAGCQRVNANGLPLVGATLTVYNGGTLQLSSVYQDIGLAIPAQNPMTTDQTGALPFFYVADGTYRVRLVDATGLLIYDYPQLASIGASSSGGGGSGVDPTTIAQTGDEIFRKIGGIRAGWVRQNALTIGSATSGALERANADCQPLFLYLWANYTNVSCPVLGGRGSSAASDWAANKQIALPDMRGRAPVGVDAMGAGRANRVPDSNVTSAVSGGADTGDTAAAYGGEANHALIANEMPTHNHGVTDPGHAHAITDPTHSHGVSDPGHSHVVNDPTHTHAPSSGSVFITFPGGPSTINAGPTGVNTSSGTTAASSTGISIDSNTTGVGTLLHDTGITINGNTTGITTQNAGGGGEHNNMQPFILGTWFIKL